MFVPGEHFLAAAAERAPELIETAFRNGVVIASTINMLALAKIMAGMWRQESLQTQAQEVAEVGKELYKRLSVMGGHVQSSDAILGMAPGAYNDFVGSPKPGAHPGQTLRSLKSKPAAGRSSRRLSSTYCPDR